MKTNETKNSFSENINKIDNPLARLTKKTQITNMKNETGNFITDSEDIKRIRKYYKQLYTQI